MWVASSIAHWTGVPQTGVGSSNPGCAAWKKSQPLSMEPLVNTLSPGNTGSSCRVSECVTELPCVTQSCRVSTATQLTWCALSKDSLAGVLCNFCATKKLQNSALLSIWKVRSLRIHTFPMYLEGFVFCSFLNTEREQLLLERKFNTDHFTFKIMYSIGNQGYLMPR